MSKVKITAAGSKAITYDAISFLLPSFSWNMPG